MSEQWTDDEIIGAILAGGHERRLKACGDFGSGFDVRVHEKPIGPVCAVSAGILFAGLKRADDPITAFTEKYGVSHEVARGVSCGFEDYNWLANDDSGDYARGWAIGAAVRSAIEDAP